MKKKKRFLTPLLLLQLNNEKISLLHLYSEVTHVIAYLALRAKPVSLRLEMADDKN